ncbi:hypothetical protein LOK49_LG11G00681 [Camellia lanceoleosa]|uniref:Uncharacterized protein n=1 Tax=Camellia lanceoleosa TaxID=1840588 RepID=A0ACC0G4A3_9ERIC|nr:hypothetical protein LOK49_LG11G00681 [Camellia lanceoleosa]
MLLHTSYTATLPCYTATTLLHSRQHCYTPVQLHTCCYTPYTHAYDAALPRPTTHLNTAQTPRQDSSYTTPLLLSNANAAVHPTGKLHSKRPTTKATPPETSKATPPSIDYPKLTHAPLSNPLLSNYSETSTSVPTPPFTQPLQNS